MSNGEPTLNILRSRVVLPATNLLPPRGNTYCQGRNPEIRVRFFYSALRTTREAYCSAIATQVVNCLPMPGRKLWVIIFIRLLSGQVVGKNDPPRNRISAVHFFIRVVCLKFKYATYEGLERLE